MLGLFLPNSINLKSVGIPGKVGGLFLLHISWKHQAVHCGVSAWPGQEKKYQEHLRGYENMLHCPKAQIKTCRIPPQPVWLPSEGSETLKVLLFLEGLQKH